MLVRCCRKFHITGVGSDTNGEFFFPQSLDVRGAATPGHLAGLPADIVDQLAFVRLLPDPDGLLVQCF